ncbi:MAG: hypothetical protein KBF64_07715 [Anaerolineaceae bacterium]|nr:hypothetical protein [Anaerolineaceae bacterium]
MKFLRKAPLSPFILTFYAVLSLWVVNFDQIPFFSVWRVLGLTLIIAVLVLMAFRLILRNWVKAGLVSGLAMLLFVIYGHVYNLVKENAIFGFTYGRHLILLPLTAAILIIGCLVTRRLGNKLNNINQWINLVVLFLLVVVGVQACNRLIILGSTKDVNNKKILPEKVAAINAGNDFPDVYYILMDSYSRQDLLMDTFGYDNSDFIDELKNMGFVVPSCTQSNYDGTEYSLSSSLNMNYIEELGIPMDSNLDATDFYVTVRSNLVSKKFRSMGYQYVTFKSLYPFLDIANSDIYYDIDMYQPFYNKIESISFQGLFFRTTIFRAILGAEDINPEMFGFIPDLLLRVFNPESSKLNSYQYRLYDQYKFALTKLAELPNIPGPKFVYAHLYITHNPFVFQKDGKIRESFETDINAYLDQVTFSNHQLIEIIETIIEKSDQPPIIIIQGDHAYKVVGEDRVKILNAYYLPDGGNDLVYDSITPVNTFRLIFNQYFNGNLDLLPDHSYHRMTTSDTDVDFYEASGSCVK